MNWNGVYQNYLFSADFGIQKAKMKKKMA